MGQARGLQLGIAYGGNKTRKLEYLVADALAQGCDTLVSIGGVQSNHTRQVAAVAARVGLKCVLIQESWVDWPDSVYDKVGNILISRLAGADVRLVRPDSASGSRRAGSGATGGDEGGGQPYPIPAGASDHPLGGLGFANWAYEVAEQEQQLGVFFDTIVVCSVTGSTQAGMIAGFAALADAGGRTRRVLGVDGSAKPAETRAQIDRIARATATAIGLDRELRDDEIELDERYHAGVYGIPDDATLDAMRLAARTEGMITDPVYEGKSMAGMIDLVERGEIRPGLHGAVRAPGRPAGAERVQRAVQLNAPRRNWVSAGTARWGAERDPGTRVPRSGATTSPRSGWPPSDHMPRRSRPGRPSPSLPTTTRTSGPEVSVSSARSVSAEPSRPTSMQPRGRRTREARGSGWWPARPHRAAAPAEVFQAAAVVTAERRRGSTRQGLRRRRRSGRSRPRLRGSVIESRATARVVCARAAAIRSYGVGVLIGRQL